MLRLEVGRISRLEALWQVVAAHYRQVGEEGFILEFAFLVLFDVDDFSRKNMHEFTRCQYLVSSRLHLANSRGKYETLPDIENF